MLGDPVYLLAQLREPYVEGTPLLVHACLPVVLDEVPAHVRPGLDVLRALAAEVSGAEINRELLELLDAQTGGACPDEDGAECKRIVEGLKDEMRRVSKTALDMDDEGLLERVTQEYMGDGKRDDVWKLLLYLVPFDLSAEALPDDQVWVVDRPPLGDGLCGDLCCKPTQ
jgi:hypothetical protein